MPLSRFNHVLKSILLGKYSSGILVAAIEFSSYCDGSGKPDVHRVTSVGGGIAPIKDWLALEKRWQAILKRENVSCYHATHFASSQGEFKEW